MNSLIAQLFSKYSARCTFIIVGSIFLSANHIYTFPYQLKVKKNLADNAHPLSFVDDLNNNAYSEAIIIENSKTRELKNRIKIMDAETKHHYHSEPLWVDLLDIKAYDLTQNGNKEILYTYQDKDSLFLKIYAPFQEGKVLLHQKILEVQSTKENEYWGGGLFISDFGDFNHDGFVDILLHANTGYDKYPRGPIAFDYHNKRILWKYWIGPIASQVFARDVNYDGHFEIYIQNWAPANGARINNTDDFHSYFIVLNEKGEKIFQETTGGKNTVTSVIFANFNDSNSLDLISHTKTSNFDLTTGNQIIKWTWIKWPDLYREEISQSIKLRDGFNIQPYNGIPYLMVVNEQFELCMLDSALEFKKSIPLNERIFTYYNTFDLNKDGKKEFIWRTMDNYGAIGLNQNLEKLYKITNCHEIFRVQYGRTSPFSYALLEPNGKFYEFTLEPVSVWKKYAEYQWVFLLMLLILINALIWLWLRIRNNNPKILREKIRLLDNSQSAVLIMNRRGKIISHNKKTEKLLDLSKSAIQNLQPTKVFSHSWQPIGHWIQETAGNRESASKEFDLMIDDKERRLQIHIEPIYSTFEIYQGAFITINDLTPILHTSKTTTWVTVAQKLAHEIKNPLSAIRLTLQRLKIEYENQPKLKEQLREFVEGGLDDVNRLRKVVDDFMHFSKAGSAQIDDIKPYDLIQEVADRYALRVPEGIHIHTEVEGDLPSFSADRSQMITLLFNLMDNSIDAIHPPGVITLKACHHEKINHQMEEFLEKYIEIEISDTGEGMDQNQQDKIFNPFYTTKEGGSGLGMNIIQKIVKDHAGNMEIFSRKGLGTRIVIQIPINQPEEDIS